MECRRLWTIVHVYCVETYRDGLFNDILVIEKNTGNMIRIQEMAPN